jgi:hypothetical protein
MITEDGFETSGLACKQPEPYDYRPQWAREGLALPISTRPRRESRSDAYRCDRSAPLGFLIDGTACTDDNLRFPRTAREAFGHYSHAPLRRFSFLPCQRGGWCGIAVAVLLLAGVIFWSVK